MDKMQILLLMLCLLTAKAEADLREDAYSESCPEAAGIIRSSLRKLYEFDNTIAPALLRLFFHDCFVMGCDASILLDSDGPDRSEKDASPNLTVRGFEEIDAIKAVLEQECPGVVSCADIIVLAARESVVLAGGEFYPVLTGRQDSMMPFFDNVPKEIPFPNFNLTQALHAFAAKGFDAGEMVALLGGGHSTGKIHCNFIQSRLASPDPSIDPDFLELLSLSAARGTGACSWTTRAPGLASERSTSGASCRVRGCCLSISSSCPACPPAPSLEPMRRVSPCLRRISGERWQSFPTSRDSRRRTERSVATADDGMIEQFS